MPYIEEVSSAGAAIQPLPTSVTGFVGACSQGPVDTPVVVASPAEYHATFGPSLDGNQPLGHAVDLFFANGGTSATVVRAAGPAPELLVPTAGVGGLHALDGAGVTVLVVPGLTAVHSLPVAHALNWCAERRAVLLLDLPLGPWGNDARAAAAQAGPHRERAAVYHPWLVMGGVEVSPSGAVAGSIAHTVATRGVWKAPANVALHGIGALTETIDEAAGQLLTEHGVNPIREFPGRGLRVWGARTLAAVDSAEPSRRYLAMRRLVDHISGSLAAGLEFAVFEPNEAPLWARVRMLAGNFLLDLWRRGALQGTTPEEAFGVRCGLGETMTQADLEAGRLVLTVFVATLKPAEFDVLTVRVQTLTGAEHEDVTRPFLLRWRRNLPWGR